MAFIGKITVPTHARSTRAARQSPAWVVAVLLLISVFWGLAVVITGGILAVLAFGAIVGIACVFLNYRIGVWLLILFLPLSSSYLFPHQLFGITGLNPYNVIIVLTTFSYLVGRGFTHKREQSGSKIASGVLPLTAPPYKWLFWLLVVPIVVAGIHGAPNVSKIPAAFLISDPTLFLTPGAYLRDTVVKPVMFVLFSILVGVAVRGSSRPTAYLVPACISVVLLVGAMIALVGLSGISIKALSLAQSREFFAPLGRHANELGLMLNMAYVMSLAAWYRTPLGSGWAKTGLLITAVLAAIGVALTFSRGAFLTFVIVSALFLVSRRRLDIVLIGLVGAAVVALLLPGEIYDRALTGISSGGTHGLTAGRLTNIWPQLFPEFLHSPLIGNGLHSTLWAEAIIRGTAPLIGHPHSAYLALLTDMGSLGAILVGAFYTKVWGAFRRLMHEAPSAALAGVMEGGAFSVIVLAIQGISDDRFTPTPEQAFLWLAVGFLLGIWRETSQPSQAGSPSVKLV